MTPSRVTEILSGIGATHGGAHSFDQRLGWLTGQELPPKIAGFP